MFGFHILFSGLHLIRISADRIDLSVMYDETIRMSALPAWIRIGTESGMYQSNRRFIVLILQILKKGPKLSYQEHPLIGDRPAGKRRHISIVAALLKDTAHHIKPPVKINPLLRLLRTLNESLHNTRHTSRRTASQYLWSYRRFSPPKEIHTLFLHDHLEDFLRLIPLQFILRKEEHTDSIISLRTQKNAERLTDPGEELMRNLQ